MLRLVKTRPSLRLGPSETTVIRVLDQERIDRINQDLTRAWKADVETTCVLSGILLLPCLILICLLDGPLFAKVILCTFLCLMVGGWCTAKWLNAQAQPRTDITGVKVEQLEGYFDRRWVRNGGKPYIEYSFGKHWLRIQTSACSFFSGDTQLKLNRRYRTPPGRTGSRGHRLQFCRLLSHRTLVVLRQPVLGDRPHPGCPGPDPADP
ncbi:MULTISPECIES: hypothetical protein [unclassified Pseudomonas]|uniref:hypothetical protein n=1 Tax=unclassified Pseudomonas TaxID=196821 RepID=UPI000A7E54EF|nr:MULTISPECIES: hypothetical protein [unclassified Pseudomonas]